MPGRVSRAFYAPRLPCCISVWVHLDFCDDLLLRPSALPLALWAASLGGQRSCGDSARRCTQGGCTVVLVSACWFPAWGACDLLHACVELMRQELSWPLPRARSFPTVRRHRICCYVWTGQLRKCCRQEVLLKKVDPYPVVGNPRSWYWKKTHEKAWCGVDKDILVVVRSLQKRGACCRLSRMGYW